MHNLFYPLFSPPTSWIAISHFSDCVVAGNNELQIRVANTWNNRLVADAALPIEERQSYVSQPYRFKKDAPLVKSGLWGPVKIKH